jgi:hypothetical protein
MLYIYDLDDTVIDSRHRQLRGADKIRTLAYWRANNTPARVAQDRPLPLLDTLKAQHRAGHTIVLCTSRIMGPADYAWLWDHGVPFYRCLHRTLADNTTPCGELKHSLLLGLCDSLGWTWEWLCQNAAMLDDSQDVQKTLGAAGLIVLDPAIIETSQMVWSATR